MSTINTSTTDAPAGESTEVEDGTDVENENEEDTDAEAGTDSENEESEDSENEDENEDSEGDEESEDDDEDSDDGDVLSGLFDRVDKLDVLTEDARTFFKEAAQNPALAEATLLKLGAKMGEDVSHWRNMSRQNEAELRKLRKETGEGGATVAPAPKDTPAPKTEEAGDVASVKRELSQVRAAAIAGLPIELAGTLDGDDEAAMVASAKTIVEKLESMFGAPAGATNTSARKRATITEERQEPPAESFDDQWSKMIHSL